MGIGSEIVYKSLRDPKVKKIANWKIFGDQSRQKNLTPRKAGLISWRSLDQAVKSLKSGDCQALVTAPVSKAHLNKSGFPFPGQTEYLAKKFRAKKTAMMLAAPNFKVVLVTIHIPLKKVFRKLDKGKILETILVTHSSLRKDFGIKKPSIAVCGLNPHAGEEGLLGDEERKIITPAIKKAKQKKIRVSGPYPPDVVFYQARLGKYDAVICHYHDQGLIPIKTVDFHEGVNTTLGLPIVRTSPDQGCAFDIAGKGIANPSSMKTAMRLAVEMWRKRRSR